MLLVSVISYIDRNTLALLAPTILQETHLTNEQYGWIISAKLKDRSSWRDVPSSTISALSRRARLAGKSK